MYKLLESKSERFGVVINTSEVGIGVLITKSLSGLVVDISLLLLHIYFVS
ncbi:hypothetical protein [Lachnotalea glycerini]|nr:hypothetical protein [Lachnotalea glycerini]